MRGVRCEAWRREKSSERRAADGLQQRLKVQDVAAAETTAQAAAAAFAAYFAVILLGQNLRVLTMFGLIKVKADNLRHMTMCEFAPPAVLFLHTSFIDISRLAPLKLEGCDVFL